MNTHEKQTKKHEKGCECLTTLIAKCCIEAVGTSDVPPNAQNTEELIDLIGLYLSKISWMAMQRHMSGWRWWSSWCMSLAVG